MTLKKTKWIVLLLFLHSSPVFGMWDVCKKLLELTREKLEVPIPKVVIQPRIQYETNKSYKSSFHHLVFLEVPEVSGQPVNKVDYINVRERLGDYIRTIQEVDSFLKILKYAQISEVDFRLFQKIYGPHNAIRLTIELFREANSSIAMEKRFRDMISGTNRINQAEDPIASFNGIDKISLYRGRRVDVNQLKEWLEHPWVSSQNLPKSFSGESSHWTIEKPVAVDFAQLRLKQFSRLSEPPIGRYSDPEVRLRFEASNIMLFLELSVKAPDLKKKLDFRHDIVGEWEYTPKRVSNESIMSITILLPRGRFVIITRTQLERRDTASIVMDIVRDEYAGIDEPWPYLPSQTNTQQ